MTRKNGKDREALRRVLGDPTARQYLEWLTDPRAREYEKAADAREALAANDRPQTKMKKAERNRLLAIVARYEIATEAERLRAKGAKAPGRKAIEIVARRMRKTPDACKKFLQRY